MAATKNASLGNILRNNQGDPSTGVGSVEHYNSVSTFKTIDNTVVSAYDVARNKGYKKVSDLHERTFSSLSKGRGTKINDSSQCAFSQLENHKGGDVHNQRKDKVGVDGKQSLKFAHLRKPPINRRKIPQPVSLTVAKVLNPKKEKVDEPKVLNPKKENVDEPVSGKVEITVVNETDIKPPTEAELDGQIRTKDITDNLSRVCKPSVENEDFSEVFANIESENINHLGNVEERSDVRHLSLPSQSDLGVSNRLGHRRKLPRVPLQRTSSPKADQSTGNVINSDLRYLSASCSSLQDWGTVDHMFDGVTPASSIDFSETSETTDSSSVSYLNSSGKTKMEEGKDSAELNRTVTKGSIPDKSAGKELSHAIPSQFSKSGKAGSESHSYMKKVNEKLKTKYVSKMANAEVGSTSDRIKANGEQCKSTGLESNSLVKLDGVVDTVSVPNAHATQNNSKQEGENMLKNSYEIGDLSKCISNDLSGQSDKGESLQDMDVHFDGKFAESNRSEINISKECSEQSNSEEAVVQLPENLFFSFNTDVIQELTDGVMGAESAKVVHANGEDIKNSELETDTNIVPLTKTENVELIAEVPQQCETQLLKSPEDKATVEGKSVSGKEVNTSHKTESNDDVSVNKPPQTQRQKVERTPSYRNRVMARAKSRHGKRSNKCKECSCTRNEYGEITVCQFCENYEMKMKRSHTSLGNVTHKVTADINDSESSEISSPRRTLTPGLPPLPSIDSPKTLRRVQVSPRVELLMSSGLFRKHLHKHEDLLSKHMMSYKRFGMKKSVSNLDLSDGYNVDSDLSQCESEDVNGENRLEDDSSEMNHSVKMSSMPRNRRHSLTGESQSSVECFQRVKSSKGFDTIPNSRTRSRPPIPNFQEYNGRNKHHYPIPSFNEFRRKSDREPDRHMDNIGTKGTGAVNTVTTSDSGKKDIVCEAHLGQNLNTIVETNSTENLLDIIQNDSKSDYSRIVHGNTSKKESDKVITHTKEIETKLGTDGEQEINIKPASAKSLPLAKEPVKRQTSTPNLFEKKPNRVRRKLKSRTLSQVEMETDGHHSSTGDLSLSDTCSSSQSTPRRTSGKRPRSLISKRSSSLVVDSTPAQSPETVRLSQTEPGSESHQKLKIEHSLNRSKSDSNYETTKGKKLEAPGAAKSKGVHSRHLSLLDKGVNYVGLDLDETVSQCSTQDVGESESSTSFANSTVSDSIVSEAIIDDTSKLLSDTDEIEETGKLLTDNDETELDLSRNSIDDSMSPVLRSTSDACKITPEAARKRRERKERPYKSDPFSGTEIIPASKRCLLREERARLNLKRGQSSSSVGDDVLVFLDGVGQGELVRGDSFPSLEELNEDDEQQMKSTDPESERSWKLKKHVSNVSSLSTDSGVIGQEGSHGSQQSSPSNTLKHSKSEYHERAWQRAMDKGMRVFSSSCSDLTRDQVSDCVDCVHLDQVTIQQILNICPQCYQRRIERKKTIQEIMGTEINYGRDLTILKEEFYIPMMKAGLLNKEQLDSIFLNLDELIHVNKHFITKLKSSIHMANQHSDDDLQEVMIGNMFLESSTMFLTFENYCVNQAQAPILLESLEREKELLRIFLSVSQNDNHLLRRMHLKSFLMVPVQRIMRYPLLLDRLYKATPTKNRDKDHIKEAKEKIEDILGHINAKSRTASIKNRKSSEKHYSVTEKMEVSRVAIETLRWNRKDVCDVITSRLYMTQPIDHTWALKKCKNYKFTTVHGVLLSLVQPNNENEIHNKHNALIYNNNTNNNNNVSIESAALVLIKEKNGKYQVMREPFMLENCVVSQDPDYIDVFEILEWNKEAFLFKAESPADTKAWIQSLRQQMHNLGCWRKRRNALPNILLNHLS